MIQEITDLIFDLIGVGIFGGDHNLSRLLAQILENLVNALVEQVIGIGTLLGVDLAILDHIEYFLEYL